MYNNQQAVIYDYPEYVEIDEVVYKTLSNLRYRGLDICVILDTEDGDEY